MDIAKCKKGAGHSEKDGTHVPGLYEQALAELAEAGAMCTPSLHYCLSLTVVTLADPDSAAECTPVSNISIGWNSVKEAGSLDHPEFPPTTHLYSFWQGWGKDGECELVELIDKSKTLVVSTGRTTAISRTLLHGLYNQMITPLTLPHPTPVLSCCLCGPQGICVVLQESASYFSSGNFLEDYPFTKGTMQLMRTLSVKMAFSKSKNAMTAAIYKRTPPHNAAGYTSTAVFKSLDRGRALRSGTQYGFTATSLAEQAVKKAASKAAAAEAKAAVAARRLARAPKLPGTSLAHGTNSKAGSKRSLPVPGKGSQQQGKGKRRKWK
jgi:hypothetical protein